MSNTTLVSDPSFKRHPIQVAVRRTGLSPELLRAWERRYEAVRPARTDTGRRLYSDRDVERLRLLRQATRGGRSIGQVSTLSLERLEHLVAEDRAELEPSPTSAAANGDELAAAAHVAECLAAVDKLDAGGLDAALTRALFALRPEDLVASVLGPLMITIGRLWTEGRLNAGQEHFATSAVRATLARVIAATGHSSGPAPGMIVATPAGQKHEIGAMLLAALAAARGWRVTYLGPDLPAVEIADAVRRTTSVIAGLSIVFPTDDAALPAELLQLRESLGDDAEIMVGGSGVSAYEDALLDVGALVCHPGDDLPTILDGLRTALQNGTSSFDRSQDWRPSESRGGER